MIGRGVFPDFPPVNGVEALPSGYALGPDELDRVAEAHGAEIGRGDFVIFRRYFEKGDWGPYCGGDAPGLSLGAAA